ncbi:MAG: hypothetical protein LBP54_02940 [Campylobacteraceae bacterium]|jgi:hypothetical protein|nr:hypothetical protein [Campylobacteraceae bacterium]
MITKFIIAKLLETLIKTFIVACFILSTLVFLFFFAQDSSVDYQKVISCLDLNMYNWDYEKRLADWD